MKMLKRFWRSAPAESERHPVRVEALVVEDEEDMGNLICGLLRSLHVIVTRVHGIAGALELINGDERYQLAFVDLGLPNGSGVEVVRRIKETRRMTHVIVVTGAAEKLELAAEHGYIGVLKKPFSVNCFREVLVKHRMLYYD